MSDNNCPMNKVTPDANVEILKNMIAEIDDQLSSPERVAVAKGYSRRELAQWISRAKTARQYLVEDMISLRYEAESEIIKLKEENVKLKRQVFGLRAQILNMADASSADKVLKSEANNALHWAQDFLIKMLKADTQSDIIEALEWARERKDAILWNRKNG